MKYDLEFINPLGNPGTHYAFEAETIEEAETLSPHWLSASSQWRPEQFKIVSVKKSIYEENKE
jgi:hypothetical protein